MNQPLLSIVIANYNYGRFLEEAIQSVISQDMGDQVELIICDAASTDNSVDVIKQYADGLPPNTSYFDWIEHNPSLTTNDQQITTKITWWCSEKDGGQSAAFNKGFSHAKGEFLTWLNADDVIMPGTLKAFQKAVAQYPECEWFVGGVMWLDKGMRIIKCARGRPFSERRAKAGVVSVWGPSSFFSKRLYQKVGGVDERFVYTMDTDLWIKFWHLAKIRYLHFTNYAWGLRLHECAKMSAHHFAESGQDNPNHPKWAQLSREREWRNNVYMPQYRLTKLQTLLTINLCQSLLGRLDTFRYKGENYKEYFT